MSTLGDRILDISLPKIGEKSLFTKDLEDALRNETVDFVVHSLKDLPTSLPEGLAIGAVFEREDPRDALVLRADLKEHSLATLPPGSVIGTSSLRRTAQLRGSWPHLNVVDVRGNLNTRLRKLDSDSKDYAALLLAKSGLSRMGWEHRISKILPCSEMMYATGQGALAVECRADARAVLAMMEKHNHAETYCRVLAERSFLKTLGGGCSAPVGVSTTLKAFDTSFKLTIIGAVWSLDGTIKVNHKLEETFPSIRKTNKHKLDLDEDRDCKKLRISGNNLNEASNPIGLLNRKITKQTGNLNCVDTRTDEEIDELRGENSASKSLYCGLSENANIPIDVIIKCEKLGKNLANVLISKGALDVMKVTQDLIRGSIEKTS
ncbi:Porphobilinogen deaminase [Eumeta japonica]|uniref:hydroxymethylbilane synthase n=1 Tax=Eumeta variegata TaxID=151549 RepID=A0A4C1UI61_EUMVA|nr:Porphobilinogen deaminase [Eumeta japonica]